MPKKETGVPNLDKYLGERQRTLCNYEQGARMYGVPYYTFVNVNTDESVHTARSSSARFPLLQCMLSAS